MEFNDMYTTTTEKQLLKQAHALSTELTQLKGMLKGIQKHIKGVSEGYLHSVNTWGQEHGDESKPIVEELTEIINQSNNIKDQVRDMNSQANKRQHRFFKTGNFKSQLNDIISEKDIVALKRKAKNTREDIKAKQIQKMDQYTSDVSMRLAKRENPEVFDPASWPTPPKSNCHFVEEKSAAQEETQEQEAEASTLWDNPVVRYCMSLGG